MSRRFIVDHVSIGRLTLDERQSRHARDVLRLNVGEPVDVFDPTGRRAEGRIVSVEGAVQIEVERVQQATAGSRKIVIASAVPKGDRADWLVEKLSELNVTTWLPLRTARSVVHPEGAGKFDRWRRIAAESAKQCGRDGVLQIEPLNSLEHTLRVPKYSEYVRIISSLAPGSSGMRIAGGTGVVMLVGPEGGWTDEELAGASAAGWAAVSLGRTILRVETAAIVGASLIGQEIDKI